MIRAKKTDREVSRAWRFPWWRTCRACEREFRFEHGWVGWRWARRTRTSKERSFVCLGCAPDQDTAKASGHFGEWVPRRPKGTPPPPPPSKRYPEIAALREAISKAFREPRP